MGDPRKFWRETIGVVQARREAASAPAARRAETAPRPPATGVDLGQVERLLAELPAGSIGFAAAVSSSLWPDPTPEELAALATLAERIRAVSDGTVKRMVLRAVALRIEAARAVDAAPIRIADSSALAARSTNLERLARLAEEAAGGLDRTLAAGPNDRLVAAARQLVPSATGLQAEARLSAELARQAAAVQTGGSTMARLWRPIPETDELLAAIGRRALDPNQAVFWQVYAACSLAHAAVRAGTGCGAELARLLEIVHERLERSIDETLSAHTRGGELSARQAAWRRLLLETRAAFAAPPEEAASTPGSEPADPTGPLTGPVLASDPTGPLTGPVQPAETEGPPTGRIRRPEPRGALSEPALADAEAPAAGTAPSPADRAIVEHFRAVRSLTAPAEPAPTVRRGVLWIVALASAAAFALLAVRLVLPPSPPAPPAVGVDEFAAYAPLAGATPAGALLIATVDPAWQRMDRSEREIAALRLMTAAERHGFRAGLLLAADGRPVARWTPGRAPVLVGAEPEAAAPPEDRP